MKVIYLFIFFLTSVSSFVNASEISIFVGNEEKREVQCTQLYENYYSCKFDERTLFIDDQNYTEQPLKAIEVDINGDIHFFEIRNFKINNQTHQISTVDENVEQGKPHLNSIKEIKIQHLSTLFSLLRSRHSSLPYLKEGEQYPKELVDLKDVLSEKVSTLSNIIEDTDATIKIEQREYKCQNIEPKSNCRVSLCQNLNGEDQNERVYLVRMPSFYNGEEFRQYRISSDGDLADLRFVKDIVLDGYEEPYHPKNIKPTVGPIDYKYYSDSIITDELMAPKLFQSNPEFFLQVSDEYGISTLDHTLSSCPVSIRQEFSHGLRKLKEKIASEKLVQLIEKVTNGIRSSLVNEDLIPNGICEGQDYYYEAEAEEEIDRYLPSGPITPITMEDASRLFQEQKNRSDIAWNYQDDGCYARAHLMTRAFDQEGIVADKVWARGDFFIKGNNGNDIRWNYHVAPVVYVEQSNGLIERIVIDPSVSDKPLPVDQWLTSFEKNNFDREPEIALYPLPEDAISYSRTILSFSNMWPMGPSMEPNVSDDELTYYANEAMKRYLDRQ